MIMFGSFLPSLLVGFSTTNFTRASEPTLSWNHLHSLTGDSECNRLLTTIISFLVSNGAGRKDRSDATTFGFDDCCFVADMPRCNSQESKASEIDESFERR